MVDGRNTTFVIKTNGNKIVVAVVVGVIIIIYCHFSIIK
jgi:hypothetical protein